MVQFYFITELFLLVSAGLFLTERYGSRLLFLINLRDYFLTQKGVKLAYLIVGLLSIVSTLLFPIEPGPMFYGDALVSFTVILDLIRFVSFTTDYQDKKNTRLGVFTLVIALVHLVFPTLVII